MKATDLFKEDDIWMLIVSHLKLVNKTILAVDTDRTVQKTIKKIHTKYSEKYELFFANGGDQNNKTIPERTICEQLGVKLIDGLGDKIQSSSWLLKK